MAQNPPKLQEIWSCVFFI